MQEITGGCCKARGRKGLDIYGVFSCSRRYKVASQLIVVSRLVVPSSRSHSRKAKKMERRTKKLGVLCVLNCEKLSQAGVIRPPVAMI